MRLIIAGSRTIECSHEEIEGLINHFGINPSEIVSGTARGVDQSGEKFSKKIGLPVTRFPADWDQYGKLAGLKRNSEMAIYADALLLIWDGKSKGSAHMKKAMEGLGKPVYEAILNPLVAHDEKVYYTKEHEG